MISLAEKTPELCFPAKSIEDLSGKDACYCMTTYDILKKTKESVPKIACLSAEEKNRALFCMAESLKNNMSKILLANKEDVEFARGKISDVMIDRLLLTEERIMSMAQGIVHVAELPDPTGRILQKTKRENGLVIEKVSVPLGVIGIIYESRPNVTSDAAALCFKSGNACVLRSGREAIRSSSEIVAALKKGLCDAGVCSECINIVEDTDRKSAREMMEAQGYIDMLIPRGGAGLIKACVENAKVPCIQTGTGICHIYVDESADIDMALNIVYNAKLSRPSVCNACEVCLVNKNIAEKFLPKLKEKLCDERISNNLVPAELRLDEYSQNIISGKKAGENDFDTEFLDYILAVKAVENVKEAVEHINKHTTHHSESIITGNMENAEFFMNNIDSAALYVNASTRFTDGGEFGLGCEMGISTQKLHARGPIGLCELTTYKYKIYGNGQIR